jgi:hypothetical protein
VEWGFLQPLHADVETQNRTDNMQHAALSSICQEKHVKPDEHRRIFTLYRQKPLTATMCLTQNHEFMTSKGSDFAFRFTVDCLWVASVSDFNCRHHHKVDLKRSQSWPQPADSMLLRV